MNQNSNVVGVWFSGFFALGALVHALRFLFRVSLTVDSFSVPLRASLVMGIIFAVLSIACWIVSKGKCCVSK